LNQSVQYQCVSCYYCYRFDLTAYVKIWCSLLPIWLLRHIAIVVILIQLHCPTSEQLIIEHSFRVCPIQWCTRRLHAGLEHWSFLLELHNVCCNRYNKKNLQTFNVSGTDNRYRSTLLVSSPTRDDGIWNSNFINWWTSSETKSVLLRLINLNERSRRDIDGDHGSDAKDSCTINIIEAIRRINNINRTSLFEY